MFLLCIAELSYFFLRLDQLPVFYPLCFSCEISLKSSFNVIFFFFWCHHFPWVIPLSFLSQLLSSFMSISLPSQSFLAVHDMSWAASRSLFPLLAISSIPPLRIQISLPALSLGISFYLRWLVLSSDYHFCKMARMYPWDTGHTTTTPFAVYV